jgi:hypothetical protein
MTLALVAVIARQQEMVTLNRKTEKPGRVGLCPLREL